ncbi:MAG: hypothetical protein ACERKZ_20875 [Lachnotalea sp.]
MEQVEKYDELIKEFEDYQILMYKVVRYLIVGIGCIFMVIPVQDMKEDGLISVC